MGCLNVKWKLDSGDLTVGVSLVCSAHGLENVLFVQEGPLMATDGYLFVQPIN